MPLYHFQRVTIYFIEGWLHFFKAHFEFIFNFFDWNALILGIDHFLAKQLQQEILEIDETIEPHRFAGIDDTLHVRQQMLNLLQTAERG